MPALCLLRAGFHAGPLLLQIAKSCEPYSAPCRNRSTRGDTMEMNVDGSSTGS